MRYAERCSEESNSREHKHLWLAGLSKRSPPKKIVSRYSVVLRSGNFSAVRRDAC